MKILASRQSVRYEDYVASGKFNSEQLRMIERGFDLGFKPAQIGIYAQPEFNTDQMHEIVEGFANGLSFKDVLVYASPKYSSDQMFIIRDDLEEGMPRAVVELAYTREDLTASQMEDIHYALYDDMSLEDIRALVDVDYDWDVVSTALERVSYRDMTLQQALAFRDYAQSTIIPQVRGHRDANIFFNYLWNISSIFAMDGWDEELRQAALELCLPYEKGKRISRQQFDDILQGLDFGVPIDLIAQWADPDIPYSWLHKNIQEYIKKHSEEDGNLL